MEQNQEQKCVILDPNPYADLMEPVDCPEIWDLRNTLMDLFWKAHDIDLSQEHKFYMESNADERKVIQCVLAFFAFSDGIVMKNLGENFASEVQNPESRAFFAYQTANEAIHSEAYINMIRAIQPNTIEADKVIKMYETDKTIVPLVDWAHKWMDPNTHTFAERLVAFALYEGLIFQAMFAFIFHFKDLNRFTGIREGNMFIAKDESLHYKHAVMVYNRLAKRNRAAKEAITQITRDAVEADTNFIRSTLVNGMIGMSLDDMVDYIHMVANNILKDFGCDPIYVTDSDNPVAKMMDPQGLSVKTNFFEKRNPDYKGASGSFSLDADF